MRLIWGEENGKKGGWVERESDYLKTLISQIYSLVNVLLILKIFL